MICGIYVLQETNKQKTINFLIPHHPRTAKFYQLPRIHKPGNSGRPIVSSNGAPMESISRFVDYFLQPCVSTLLSYIRDTNYVVEAGVPTIILFCGIREDVDDLYKWQTFWHSGLHQSQISYVECDEGHWAEMSAIYINHQHLCGLHKRE